MSDQPYHLADRGQSLGTMDLPGLLAGLATGRLSPDVLSWREGEPGWIPLRARAECASGISAGSSLQAPPPVMPWEAEIGAWSVVPRPAQYWRTAKAVLFRTEVTLSGVASTDLRATLQWLGWSSVAAILIGFPLWSVLLSFRPALFAFLKAQEAASPAVFNLTYFGRALVVYPLAALLGTFGVALLVHGLMRLFGGGRGGWRSTFRALAYVVGAFCFVLAVPLFGCIVPFWAFVLFGLSLGYAHREPAWRAFISLGLVLGVGSCAGLIAAAWSFSRNFMR